MEIVAISLLFTENTVLDEAMKKLVANDERNFLQNIQIHHYCCGWSGPDDFLLNKELNDENAVEEIKCKA